MIKSGEDGVSRRSSRNTYESKIAAYEEVEELQEIFPDDVFYVEELQDKEYFANEGWLAAP